MKRRFGIALAAALTLGSMPAFAGAALAEFGECEDGDKYITVNSKVVSWAITHMKGVSVAPGLRYTQETTVGWVATISAGIDGTWSSTVKGDLIIAKAEATFALNLHVSGSKTSSYSQKVTWDSGPTKTYARKFALFQGTQKVTGNYVYKSCGRTNSWGPTSYGSLQSFTFDYEGSALCGYAYPSGSIEKAALIKLGC